MDGPKTPGARWPLWSVAALILLGAFGAAAWRFGPRDDNSVPGRIERINRLADALPVGAPQEIATAAVEDPHALVRQAALLALGRLRDDRCRQAVEAGTRDRAPLARMAAAEALARYGDAPAVKRLGEMLGEDPTEWVRTSAAEGLGRIGSPEASGALLAVARGKTFPPVRRTALHILSQLLSRHRLDGPHAWPAERWRALAGEVKAAEAQLEADLAEADRRTGEHRSEHDDDVVRAETRPAAP